MLEVKQRRKGSATWYAVGTIQDPVTGRALRVRQTLETRDKVEAERRAAALYLRLTGQQDPEPTADPDVRAVRERSSLGRFAKWWWETIVLVEMSPSTQRGYRTALHRHIRPRFGDVSDLRAIRPTDVRMWRRELRARGGRNGRELSVKTVNNAVSVLSSLMRAAIEAGFAEVNPCAGIKPLDVGEQGYGFWTEAERDTFLASVAAHEPKYLALFGVQLYAGLRAGEVTGLRWSDVDLANRRIRVARSVAVSWDGEMTVKAPKSGRSRLIPIPGVLVRMLEGHPQRLGSDLVFPRDVCHPKHGWFRRSQRFYKALDRCAKRAGVSRIRVHDLRHTYATHLVMKGVPMVAVRDYLGHTDIKTTQQYAHHAPLARGSWADVLDRGVATNVATVATPKHETQV
jgi:integrase